VTSKPSRNHLVVAVDIQYKVSYYGLVILVLQYLGRGGDHHPGSRARDIIMESETRLLSSGLEVWLGQTKLHLNRRSQV